MEKTATLNLRVDPIVKSKAEGILDQLGIPISTAVNMYLYQISLTGGIPFALTLPKAPDRVNVETMTDEQLLTKLQRGYNDIEAERVQDAHVNMEIPVSELVENNVLHGGGFSRLSEVQPGIPQACILKIERQLPRLIEGGACKAQVD